MQKSKNERQEHLDLDSTCIEIGGRNSTEYRGLLAHFLLTTIPIGSKIVLCHACNNHACSNIKHMYWGTAKENWHDGTSVGPNKNLWQRTIEKYGVDGAKEILTKARKASHNKTRVPVNKLSPEEINRRKKVILTCQIDKFGWVSEAARKLDVSHTSIKRFVRFHMKDVKFFQKQKMAL